MCIYVAKLDPLLSNLQSYMDDTANELFAIEVDVDDYAETASSDTPTVPRTFQSEADFQAQRATYHAKIDEGNNYEELMKVLHAHWFTQVNSGSGLANADSDSKVKLKKRDVQLLGYAVGEMYHSREYTRVVKLCQLVHMTCEVDSKTCASLEKWIKRCEEKLRAAEEARR